MSELLGGCSSDLIDCGLVVDWGVCPVPNHAQSIDSTAVGPIRM